MVGRTITGKFKVLQQIDSGGMGSVFKADQLDLSRTVAIKKINPELTGDADALERFKLEAKALAAITHGNVATIYDFVVEDGEPFLVMEYVAGHDLYRLIGERGALPLNVAAPIFCGMLRGFSAIHGRNIVHRDIKPKNVIVTPSGESKIIDFGIARMAGRSGVTQFGQTLGTPVYMSPEQVHGEELDVRSDLYSLAVVLFEMLAGAPPFPEDGEVPVQKAHVMVTPPALSSKVKGLPKELDRILAKGLDKKPNRRYRTADEFRAALEAALPPGMCSATAPVAEFLEKLGRCEGSDAAATPIGATMYAGDVPGETRFESASRDGGTLRGRAITRRWILVAAVVGLLVFGSALGVLVLTKRTQPRPAPVTPIAQPVPAPAPPAPAPAPENAGQPNPAVTEPPPVEPAKVVPAKPAVAATQSTPGRRRESKQEKAIDPAEKKRIDALKALGEYREDKKQ
jgi:eukaryotic-like serine/threonine-protein kinase